MEINTTLSSYQQVRLSAGSADTLLWVSCHLYLFLYLHYLSDCMVFQARWPSGYYGRLYPLWAISNVQLFINDCSDDGLTYYNVILRPF